MNPVLYAFGLTLFAGMATGIGSIIAFAAKRTNYRFLSVSTGFSAGVMLYVSFVEILRKGGEALVESFGPVWGERANVVAFFSGILVIGLIDNLIPTAENPHETHSKAEMMPLKKKSADRSASRAEGDEPVDGDEQEAQRAKLMRMGLFTALAITIHNFPEGLATFLSALKDPHLGVAIAIAVALHNIPEGISVSVPIFYATGNRRKAFIYSLLSGLAEPFGAVIAFFGLRLLLGDTSGVIPSHIMGIMFSVVAGIMVYISLDELLPTSRAYGKGHDSLLGLIAGMLVMAVSMLMLK